MSLCTLGISPTSYRLQTSAAFCISANLSLWTAFPLSSTARRSLHRHNLCCQSAEYILLSAGRTHALQPWLGYIYVNYKSIHSEINGERRHDGGRAGSVHRQRLRPPHNGAKGGGERPTQPAIMRAGGVKRLSHVLEFMFGFGSQFSVIFLWYFFWTSEVMKLRRC